MPTFVKLLLPLLVLLAGCENAQFRNREKAALAGGALGAGLGAIVGRHTGGTGAGIAIGSAMGALSGALVGNQLDNQEDKIAETDQRLSTNERDLAANRRILDELKSRGVDARLTDRGVVANLPDVLFEFDKARLTNQARDTVRDISSVVRNNPGHRISVEGHTDSVGTTEYNLHLSRERANSVAAALEQQSVGSSSVRTRGFGESHPVASNDSEVGRSRNRRVEVVIESAGR